MQVVFAFFNASWGKCYLWCQIEWHRAQSTQALCLACAFLFPWGGRGNDVITGKKKKDACALPDLFGLPFFDALMRALRRLPVFLHCRSTYYVACRCPCGLLHKRKKTKKKKTTHERCNCYAASLSAVVEPDATFLRSSICCS